MSMRKAILVSLGALAAAMLAVAGGDAWKVKPYQQWDNNDVRKILSDSPWAKVVYVDNPGGNLEAPSGLPEGSSGGSAGVAPAGGGGGGAPKGGGGGAPKGGGGGGGAPAPGTSNTGPVATQLALVVRWVSSRTIREAFLRSQVLSGHMTASDAETQLSQPADAYEVAITGQMSLFEQADESTLQSRSFLTTKKTKQKIPPAKVEIERGPDGKSVQALAFFFPKRSANGESAISAEEKGVEFSCSFKHTNIKVVFDIQKMDDLKGRDL
jgi:hypothetical protein